MKQLSLQNGLSHIGFIAASGLYIGLIVYTTQYAFVNQTDIVSVEETPLSKVKASISSIIAPLAGGIFKSETISSDALDSEQPLQAGTATNFVEQAVIKQTVIKEAEVTGVSFDESEVTTAKVENKTTDGLQDIADYKITPTANSAMDEFSASNVYKASYQQANDYNQYLSGKSYGDGRGYGKSRASVQREFNFSMKFKSRAKVNADSNWDSRFYNAANSTTAVNTSYQQDVSVQPGYGYNYYQN